MVEIDTLEADCRAGHVDEVSWTVSRGASKARWRWGEVEDQSVARNMAPQESMISFSHK